MTESKASEVMSPRLPAIGVAMLSGFTCNFFDRTITAAVTSPSALIIFITLLYNYQGRQIPDFTEQVCLQRTFGVIRG